MGVELPYLLPLKGALNIGNAIIVKGENPGPKFDVNLSTGPNVQYDGNGDTIGLHLSYRQKNSALVLNSFEQGKWNSEEILGAGVIKGGNPVEITLAVDEAHFQIHVNNNYLGDFNYRVPLQSITHVHVTGDLVLHGVEVSGAGPDVGPTPLPEPEPTPVPPGPGPEPGPLPEPGPHPEPGPAPGPGLAPTPYVLPIPAHFGPGHKLRINGVPGTNPVRFHVNFYVGFLNAFHYEPRFDSQIIARNSRKAGEEWDKEVETDNKLPQFPFAPNQPFELVYLCDNDGFQVFVDGQQQCAFKHRLPPNGIELVGIEGDLQLAKVDFE